MTEPEKSETTDPAMVNISKSEHEALLTKAKAHDGYGGARRTLEKGQKALKESEVALAQSRKERDTAELENAGDDKEELSAVRARQRVRDAERERDEAKRENERLTEALGEANQGKEASEQKETAREIATRLNVDSKPLIQAAAKLDEDDLEALAKTLQKLPEEPEMPVGAKKGPGATKNYADMTPTERLKAIEGKLE
ncbi:hypothetical protein LCGC14_0370320 [marine sediment metagenome]|uniref:DUF4355 domain-containing protein n=1 Tax=marine sediment metagenome TaxID=412755 RepID=A0A0F9WE50_9ZZZZ